MWQANQTAKSAAAECFVNASWLAKPVRWHGDGSEATGNNTKLKEYSRHEPHERTTFTMTNEQSAQLIIEEVQRAEAKHPNWDGIRHGHSVIEEEYIEFRDAVFADDHEQAFKEAVQLGAMALRYIKHHAPASVRMFH